MENEQKEEEGARSHFRDYLRATEIGAVVLLSTLLIVGSLSGSKPISVTTEGAKTSGLVATSTEPALPKIAQTEHFIVTDLGQVEGSAKENIATADTKIFKAPVNFKSFSYDATFGKKITLAGTCKDAYYALLVFKSTDDYRKDPARSYYNTAFVCPASGLITLEVNLKDFNLVSGEYYLFIADQGNTGSWYNPR